MDLIPRSRKLRKEQTKAESLLWSRLRNRQLANLKFRRQHPALRYILDFFCEEKMLAVELDGGQHNEPENAQYDQMRTELLQKQGIQVIRFWNHEIFENLDGVLETILDQVNPPHPASTKAQTPSSSQSADKRVCLGKITGAHGVKGLVKIHPFGEVPSLIETLGPVFTSETGPETLSITLKNPQGKTYLALVEGTADRNGAEALKGTELFVPRASLPEIEDENSFYYEDLTGMDVQDESGNLIGSVLGVHNFGAGDLLDIKSKMGGESFLLPFNNETIAEVGEAIVIRNYEEFLG